MSEPVATNRKAYQNYAILEKWECGMVLKGTEVKSLRAGEVDFKDSFARFEKEEMYLYNFYIRPYLQGGLLNEDPDRPRKLLLHKQEIKKLIGKVTQKGLTLVPTKIYFNNRGIAKIELGLAKGKKIYDKREAMKKREMDRGLDRVVKTRRKGFR